MRTLPLKDYLHTTIWINLKYSMLNTSGLKNNKFHSVHFHSYDILIKVRHKGDKKRLVVLD